MRITPERAAKVLLMSYGFDDNGVDGLLTTINSPERKRIIALGEELCTCINGLDLNAAGSIEVARKKFRSMLFRMYGQTAMYRNSSYFLNFYRHSVTENQFDKEYKLRYEDRGWCLEKLYDLRAYSMVNSFMQLPDDERKKLFLSALRAEESGTSSSIADAPVGLLKLIFSSWISTISLNYGVILSSQLCNYLALPVLLSPGVVAAASPLIATTILCSGIWVGVSRYFSGSKSIQEDDIFKVCHEIADLVYYNIEVKFFLPEEFNEKKSLVEDRLNNFSRSENPAVLPFM